MAWRAFRPVCSGSFTGWRSTTPGARRSIGANCLETIGPLPSTGCPSALTTRPSISSPTGTEMMRPVRFTGSPSLISVNSPRSTAPTLSSSRFSAMPNTPCGNSSISPAIAFSTPCTRAMPSPMEMMLPTSATSTSTAKLPICSRMILEISSALMSMLIRSSRDSGFGIRRDSFEANPVRRMSANPESRIPNPDSDAFHQSFLDLFQLTRDAAVVDGAADARDDAADNRRVDARVEHDASPRDAREAALERLRAIASERRRGRHLGAHDLAVVEQPLAIRRDEIRQQHQPIAVGQQRQQLADDARRLRARHELGHRRALAGHRHGGIEQHFLEQRILLEEVDELRQLLLDLFEVRFLLDADVEERACISGRGCFVSHFLFCARGPHYSMRLGPHPQALSLAPAALARAQGCRAPVAARPSARRGNGTVA